MYEKEYKKAQEEVYPFTVEFNKKNNIRKVVYVSTLLSLKELYFNSLFLPLNNKIPNVNKHSQKHSQPDLAVSINRNYYNDVTLQ